jgi:hypothetical protein
MIGLPLSYKDDMGKGRQLSYSFSIFHKIIPAYPRFFAARKDASLALS